MTISYFRDGGEASVAVTLEAAPGAGQAVEIAGNTRFAGTTAETLTPASAQELGLPFDAHGILVRGVAPGSPSDRMGLRPGDIILSLNGRDMTDAETFKSTANARPDGWQIVLQRGGRVFRSFVSG